jgi:hypothetical protein|tara:strand:+ start:242 stop:616 length:375 start_codon:yes stop_codon:yes gene_type:complete
MKQIFALISFLMSMPEHMRGASRVGLHNANFTDDTINRCIKKKYVRFRNWNDSVGEGVLIITALGEKYYDDIPHDMIVAQNNPINTCSPKVIGAHSKKPVTFADDYNKLNSPSNPNYPNSPRHE